MARFIIVRSIYGQPPGYAPQVFPRGTAIADTSGNAMAGDVVWPALAAALAPPTWLRSTRTEPPSCQGSPSQPLRI